MKPSAAAVPQRPAEGFSWSEIERATGSPTLRGNRIRLQFEGSSTFDDWLEAIDSAQRFVYFENYLVRDDRVGRDFREALVKKAEEGVPVFLLHDWIGCWATPRKYWKPLRQAGVRVCAFNRPSLGLGDALSVLQRDHRKLIVVDGEVAYVGGFCVGNEWAGSSSEAPWRDTGVEIRGSAARAAAVAFESLWGKIGEPIGRVQTLPHPPDTGETPIWLIEGSRVRRVCTERSTWPPRERGSASGSPMRTSSHRDRSRRRSAPRHGRRRRAHPRTRPQQLAAGWQPIPRRVSVLAGVGRADLRVARADDAREDVSRRWSLVPRRVEQPQLGEPNGKLGARCRRSG